MGSTSFQFFGFAFAVVLVYNLSRSVVYRQAVLLAASLLFLASFSLGPKSFLPFAAFLLLGYLGVRAAPSLPRYGFPLLLCVTVGVFVWLKKYAFVPGPMFLRFSYVTVGLSYILFRLLHLMIDRRSGDVPKGVTLLSYLTYTLNFTTLVSGPIQPYQEFEKTWSVLPENLNFGKVALAVERVVTGLFKTNVLALLISTLQSRALESLAAPQPLAGRAGCGVLALASYPIFLYCNFSGYIDIVIGIAQLLGIALPENFNRPFSSDNFINFWSRWHITLSNWLKTYVYNPLLMTLMRRFPSPALETLWLAVALFVTFFLVGLWHGQTSEFVFFGFLQGFGVAANRVYQIQMTKLLGRKPFQALSKNHLYVTFTRGFTFTWFTFTLLWFWSNWGQIGWIRATLGGAEALVWLAIFAGATVLLEAWESFRASALAVHCDGAPVVYSMYWRAALGTALLVVVLAVSLLMNQSAPEIVYKAF